MEGMRGTGGAISSGEYVNDVEVGLDEWEEPGLELMRRGKCPWLDDDREDIVDALVKVALLGDLLSLEVDERVGRGAHLSIILDRSGVTYELCLCTPPLKGSNGNMLGASGAGRTICTLLCGPWGVPWITLRLVLLDSAVLAVEDMERGRERAV